MKNNAPVFAALCAFSLLSAAPARAETAPVDVLVDVDQKLPRLWLLPADELALREARALARVLALSGRYEPVVARVGQRESGLSVSILATQSGPDRVTLEVLPFAPDGKKVRGHVVEVPASSRAEELARVADSILDELTGERTHLSGKILFTDASVASQRVVKTALATGASERAVSPPGAFAVGADFGPGGRAYFAMSRHGEPLRLFSEGASEPLPVKLPNHALSVAISPKGDRMAVAVGSATGSELWEGPFLGTLSLISRDAMALDPSYGRKGQLTYVSGSESGLKVVAGSRTFTLPGHRASSPSYCSSRGKELLVHGASDGMVHIVDMNGGAVRTVRGRAPVCRACCLIEACSSWVACASPTTVGQPPGDSPRPRPAETTTAPSPAHAQAPCAAPSVP